MEPETSLRDILFRSNDEGNGIFFAQPETVLIIEKNVE